MHIGNSLKLRSRLLNAAGPLACGDEFNDWEALGAFVTQSITDTPRVGNSGERLFDAPAGLINRIGLENPGIDRFLKEKLPVLREKKLPIILSLAGDTKYDYVAMMRQSLGRVDAYEINLSCPNLADGYPFRTPNAIFEALTYIRMHTASTLIVKLSAAMPIFETVRMAATAGIDAIALTNTIPARAGCGINGGLSGPAIKPIALRAVWEARQATTLPIIGIGGISRPTDLKEFFDAGASAVGVGSAWLTEPMIFPRLASCLEEMQ